MMRANSTAKTYLDAHLTDPLWWADLVTITLADGTVLRYTNADVNLTVGGNVFVAGGGSSSAPGLSVGEIEWAMGIESNTVTLEFLCAPAILLGSRPFALAAAEGALRGAHVLIESVYHCTPGNVSLGAIWLFEGDITEPKEVRASRVVVEAADWTEGLNTQLPRRVVQPACPHGFCDAACGLTVATYTDTTTVGAGATASQIPIVGARADGYFNLGVLTLTNGTDAGLTRDVVSFAGGVLVLGVPLPRAPAEGDTCTVVRGCAKDIPACTTYGNEGRYGGEPFVPKPEAVR